MPIGKLNQSKTITKQGLIRPIVDYNLPIMPTSEQTIWICERKLIRDLDFDIVEWRWKKQRVLFKGSKIL